MADNQSSAGTEHRNEEHGWPGVKAVLFENKYDSALWLLRLYCIGCTLFFLVPVFGAQFSANCFRRVILSSATISALRLHQRLPRFEFSRAFFTRLVQEDAFHYLCYSVIFLFTHPATLVLIPVTMFAILHVAKFTGRVIDVYCSTVCYLLNDVEFVPKEVVNTLGSAAGSNNIILAKLRPLMLKIENRETQQMMLQFIASSEIMMMPLAVLMLLSGQASFLVPFFYYRFVQLRYTSLRNPYSRLMFSQMRMGIEQMARNPRCPGIISRILYGFVSFISRLAPGLPAQHAS